MVGSLSLLAWYGWNDLAVAVLWPWQACSGACARHRCFQALEAWQVRGLLRYVWVRVLRYMVAKGAAFGPPRLEDHVGDHGEHMTVSKGG